MVRKILTSIITVLTVISIYNSSVQAESLFTLSATQGYNGTPKSLYAGVRAMGIGDLVSIIIQESLSSTDTMTYNSDKSSNTVDNFTTYLHQIFPFFPTKYNANNFGGENSVESSANNARNLTFGDTISTQVVQMLSNGNMVVQGKKALVNNNERVDLVVTGIVDPRWIDSSGQITSDKVANLQFAISGRGSISRGQNEGIINRVIKYLF